MADVEVNKLDLSSPLVFLESKTVLDSLPEGIAGAHYVFHKGKLYVGGGMFGGEISNKLLIYTPADDSWVIISTPTKYYAITIYESELVLLGGEDLDIHATSSNSTNGNVWLYRNEEKWVPHPKIPKIPFKISALCAVTFENRLIVATNVSNSDTTEIITFDGDNWKTAKETALPEKLPLLVAQSVLNGDTWYLSTADQLYCASLKSLVAASDHESETQLNDHPPVWTKLTALSSYFGAKTAYYGIAWFGSHLIAFETTTGVFIYDHLHDHWNHALDFSGVLPGSCYAVLPDGDLILVGGHGDCSPVKRVKHVYLKESSFPHGPLSMRALQHIDREVHLFRNISKNSKKFIRETHVACLHNIPGKKLVEAFVAKSEQTPTWGTLRRVLNVIRMKKVSRRIKTFFQSESDDEGDCKKTAVDIYQELEQELQGYMKKNPRLKVIMEKLEDKILEREDFMEQLEYERTAEFNGQNKSKLLDSSFDSETSVETDSCHERATESTERNGVIVQEKGLESIMYSETDEIDSGSEIVDLMEDKNSDDGITFVITNKKETFSAEKYGFKLDVPRQSLPSDVSECSVNVKLANPEHFEFPENTVPASHILQMQFTPSSVTFVSPITLELTPQRKFALAIANEDKKFITLSEEECFRIEIAESDNYTVGVFISNDAATLASRARQDTLEMPSYYTGHIYYSTFRGKWNVYFLVTKNKESQRKVIEKFAEERTATLDGNFPVLFRGDELSLDLQIEALPQDWKMFPLKTPVSIQLCDVNNFDENESLMVPHVHLKVSCNGEDIGEDLTHTMSFNETEKVTISLPRTDNARLPCKRPATDPCTDNAGTRKKMRVAQSGACYGKGYSEKALSSEALNTKDHDPPLDIMDMEPKFRDFVAFHWKDDESGSIKYYRLQQTFCNKWRSLAHMFGIEQSIIEATSKKTDDQMECWESIVTHWLRNGSEPSDSYPTTWKGLIDALVDVGGYGNKIKELRKALKNRVK